MARFAAAFVMPVAALCCASLAHAQSEPIFVPGTGDPAATVVSPPPIYVRQSRINCADFPGAVERLSVPYGKRAMPVASPEFVEASPPDPPVPQPVQRLDRTLFDMALASYRQHHCRGGIGSGPAEFVVIDFAKASSEPRLYALNLLRGQGLDSPIRVAHGIGSDPNDDGIADRFSNVYNSLASSVGAARGAELYHGQNGLSLRLDGLDPTNSQMRVRDIVAHSYAPQRRRYFNASLIAVRGRPGASEGCFVVAPEHRDWLFSILGNGGFLYAGLGGERAKEVFAQLAPPPPPPASGEVIFVSGTGQPLPE